MGIGNFFFTDFVSTSTSNSLQKLFLPTAKTSFVVAACFTHYCIARGMKREWIYDIIPNVTLIKISWIETVT